MDFPSPELVKILRKTHAILTKYENSNILLNLTGQEFIEMILIYAVHADQADHTDHAHHADPVSLTRL